MYFSRTGCENGCNDHRNSEFRVSIYPNPCKEFLTLNIGEDISKTGSIAIKNLTGQMIKKSEISLSITDNIIRVSDLYPGLYLLQIKTVTDTYTVKFIKL